MSYMFYGCTSLEEISFTKIKTCKVKNSEKMFYECSSLKQINLNKFNTSNVININVRGKQ